MLIYKITNLVNSKVYIGQTIQTIKQRWKRHRLSKLNRPLYNSIRKYGSSKFSIEELEKCSSIDELNHREIYWILFYRSSNKNFGYNLKEGGRRGILTEEGRKRLSLALIGRKCSEETKKKIGDANRGSNNGMFGKRFKLSMEQIERSKSAMIASKKFQSSRKSEEFRRKVSKSRGRGNWVLLDVNFNFIKEFELRMDVVKHLGCSSVNVKKAREQNRILCKTFRVMYKYDFDRMNRN